MNTISDYKQEPRRGSPESPFAKSQQMIGEIPALFQVLQKQMTQMQRLMSEQLTVAQKQLKGAQDEQQLLERVHDRLDALTVESRVTNILLAELVAIQQTVIKADVDVERNAIRNDAYNRILNGE